MNEKLIKELKKDKSEGSYYHSWQANIAMAIYDEYQREKSKKSYLNNNDIHRICNQGAENFINLIIKK
jgi:hypothetical protein